MKHDEPVALVNGANKGNCPQIAKELAAHGFTVLIGSRNLERAETATKQTMAPHKPAKDRMTSKVWLITGTALGHKLAEESCPCERP